MGGLSTVAATHPSDTADSQNMSTSPVRDVDARIKRATQAQFPNVLRVVGALLSEDPSRHDTVLSELAATVASYTARQRWALVEASVVINHTLRDTHHDLLGTSPQVPAAPTVEQQDTLPEEAIMGAHDALRVMSTATGSFTRDVATVYTRPNTSGLRFLGFVVFTAQNTADTVASFAAATNTSPSKVWRSTRQMFTSS